MRDPVHQLLYKLKLDELVSTIPTIGFNVEHVQYRNLHMTIWDVGGQDKIRVLWRHYFSGTDALIWIVDSNDRDRLDEARHEIHKVLADADLEDPLVLVYANKTDLPTAADTSFVAEKLKLHSIRNKWYIQPASAATGSGVYEGLEWLSQQMKQRPAKAKP